MMGEILDQHRPAELRRLMLPPQHAVEIRQTAADLRQ